MFRPLDPEASFAKMSEEELIQYWQQCYPAGSGPLGMMRLFCKAIESIAHLRGFDVSKWGNIKMKEFV